MSEELVAMSDYIEVSIPSGLSKYVSSQIVKDRRIALYDIPIWFKQDEDGLTANPQLPALSHLLALIKENPTVYEFRWTKRKWIMAPVYGPLGWRRIFWLIHEFTRGRS